MCPCSWNATTRISMKQMQRDFYKKLTELIDSKRYDTRSDFTVVIQPFNVESDLPMMVRTEHIVER